ncbi:hypothetical protein TWF281_002903 [Arthrobotrys megalospora]
MATYHGKVSEMASILSIPFDLIALFSEYIDDEDDFLALRMTCKDFNATFHKPHLKSIYHSRRLFYAPQSFENLLKISRHPSGVSKYVRELLICWGTPYHNVSRGHDRFIDRVEVNENGEYDEIRDTVLEIARIAGDEADEVPKFQNSGEEIAYLGFALAGFSNLRSIHIETRKQYWHPFSRSELNLFFPKAGLAPGKRLHNVLKENVLELCGVPLLVDEPLPWFFWKLPLSSILLSGITHLESLSCNPIGYNSGGFPMTWFDFLPHQLSLFKSVFANLKVLKIVIGDATSWMSTTERDIRLESKFCDWLEAVGSNLEELCLERDGGGGNSRITHLFPVKTGLPKLKRLSLLWIAISRSNFEQFLDKCKAGLQQLSIKKCALEDDPIIQCYSMLQYLRGNCLHIQEFTLEVADFRDHLDTSDLPDSELIPPYLEVNTTENSVFGDCDWEVTTIPALTCGYTTPYPVGKALRLGLCAHSFWDLITDENWGRDIVSGTISDLE